MYFIISTGLSHYLESSVTVVNRQLNNHSIKNQSYCYIVPYIANKVQAFLQDLMFDITNILNLAMLLE